MKRIFLPLLIASAMCASLTACGKTNDNNDENGGENKPPVTITESTDPLTLVGEKVDRAAWMNAFSEHTNYTVKTKVSANLTQSEDTMSANVTLIYRATPEKCFFTINVAEGKNTMMQAEAYLELDGDDVTMWERVKEGSGAWSAWDGEEYQKEDLGFLFGMVGDLSFAKDNYANFSYSDAEKGYAATTSGLTAMQEQLDAFAESILSQLASENLSFTLDKFVLKLANGKPGACILNLSVGEEGTEQRSGEEGEEDENDEALPNPDEGEGETEPGEEPSVPETPASPTGTVALTQLYYDYGTTTVTRPENLPALGGEEEGDETPQMRWFK